MFVLVRNIGSEQQEKLRVSYDIFLRPTPWKVSFQADWSWLRGENAFSYVFLPYEFSDVGCRFWLNESELLIDDENGNIVWHTPLIPMNLLTWILFHVESVIGGTLWRVWEHRYDAGTSTRKEMQKQIEILTKQVQELQEQQRQQQFDAECKQKGGTE